MPLPSAGRTWKLVKFVVRESAYAIPAAYSYLEDMLAQNEQADSLGWLRWVVEWNRTTPAGTSEDKAQFKIDLLNITGGAVDTTYTAGDFATIKALFDTFRTSLAPHIASTQQWSGYKAYPMAYNPADPGPGHRSKANGWQFQPTGPPLYRVSVSGAGTGGGALPYQCASAITLRTAWPRHWGRFYLPTPGEGSMDGTGRFGATYRGGLGTYAKALLDGLADADFLPVVPATDLHSQTFHALLGLTNIQIDDIPDIQRRRRPRQAVSRLVL